MRTRKLVVPLIAAALALAACSSGSSDDGTQAGPDRAESLVVAIGTDEGTLTPFTFVKGYPGWNMLGLVYDSLLVLDEKNVPEPLLATSVEASADGLTYTLPLREGVTWHDGEAFTAEDVTWHDGEAFTAEDVVFTFDYVRTSGSSRFASQVENVESVTAEDQTVTITLKKPNPDFTMRPLADLPIIPEHVWSGVDEPKKAEAKLAVGTGPYKLESYAKDRSYVLAGNQDYALGEPTVDKLTLSVIPEAQTAVAALRSGEVQAVAAPLNPALADSTAKVEGLSVARGPEFASTLLNLNNGLAPFDKPEVRTAIAQAIDTQALVDTVLIGAGVRGNAGFVHPDAPIFSGQAYTDTDVDAAKSALDALGAAPGPDGIRVLDGKPMDYRVLVYADSPDRIRAAELIRDQLREVDIKLTVVTRDADAVDALVWPDFDVASGRDYEMAMWGWSAPTMLSGVQVASLVNSDPVIGNLNVVGARDAELDKASDAVIAAATEDARQSATDELQKAIAEADPFVTLYYENGAYPYRASAYDGWVFQQGQGILQKLSLARLS